MAEKEKKFKVGDKITYLSKEKCGGKYKFGGDDQEGFVGEVRRYYRWHENYFCWSLAVTIKKGGTYEMLEKEFEEFYKSSLLEDEKLSDLLISKREVKKKRTIIIPKL